MRIGSRRIVALAERYGIDTLEAAFDQILKNTAEIFRREILPKIKDGEYHFEDYIEADGVDAPRLHALRLKMTSNARGVRDHIVVQEQNVPTSRAENVEVRITEHDGRDQVLISLPEEQTR